MEHLRFITVPPHVAVVLERGHAVQCHSCSRPTEPQQRVARGGGLVFCSLDCMLIWAGVPEGLAS